MKKYVIVFTVFAWALVIFYLSHQPATSSNELSKGVTKVIVELIEKVDPEQQMDLRMFNSQVRKSAHYFFYLILGMLMFTVFHWRRNLSLKRLLLAFLLCAIYAISDELHQLFVDGRGAQLKDVCIDSAGAATGIALCLIFRFFTCTPYRQSDKIE